MAIYTVPKTVYIKYIERKPTIMTLQQAKINFQRADHTLQLAWGNGDPTMIADAKRARNTAYNKVAKLIKATM